MLQTSCIPSLSNIIATNRYVGEMLQTQFCYLIAISQQKIDIEDIEVLSKYW